MDDFLSPEDYSHSEGPSNEESPLIRKTSFNSLRQRYHNTRKCVTSKAALLVLLWIFTVSLMSLFQKPNIIKQLPLNKYDGILSKASVFGVLIYCFYPLAGHLADTKFGRYKTIRTSLWVLLPALFLGTVGLILLIASHGVLILIGATIAFAGFILLIVGTFGLANVIQFGLDQLHDSPGEDQSLFIHWYMWVFYAATLIVYIAIYILIDDLSMHPLGYSCLGFITFTVLFLLIVALCVAHHKKSWFHIEPSRLNPYKLVYKVSKFAHQHKVPVRRSAFTYCEDEVPSGLDLGKDKYGGPFTTEQVEDVKAFYGILKVLFSLGPVFFVDSATTSLNSLLPSHAFNNASHQYIKIIKNDGVLYSLTAFICIPLYLIILRPLMVNHIPGMLRRMGIGILLMVLSLIFTFTMDTLTQVENKSGHMFNNSWSCELYNNSTEPPPTTVHYKTYSLIFWQLTKAFSHMFLYVALYEFICSQSPHSMKGLFIGLSYAIKGLFETLAKAIAISFVLGWHTKLFPSCEMVYYLVNIGVSLVALMVYVCVARRYKFRERDEPCNIRHYVEDYYSNIQQESL